jgi:hypothetical protein
MPKPSRLRPSPPAYPQVIPLYTPSIPLVYPLYCNRGGIQGVYKGYRGGVEGDIARPMDAQPACGNRGWQGIDPGFRLPPTNICGHFLRKAPFCWALSKRHSMANQRCYGEVPARLPCGYEDIGRPPGRSWPFHRTQRSAGVPLATLWYSCTCEECVFDANWGMTSRHAFIPEPQ